MRVLWFTNTPSLYAAKDKHNGGGWISSLEEEISKIKDIDLGISFFMDGQPQKVKRNNVTYYPLANKYSGSLMRKVLGLLVLDKHKEKGWLESYISVIEDFKPDVIEIFGSEQSFGLVSGITHVPVVLHIQGVLNPYLNAYLPPFVSVHNYIWSDCNPLKVLMRIQGFRNLRNNSERERRMIGHIGYFIGRTEWDKRLTHIFNPKAKYFYGSEILRDVFYNKDNRQLPSKPIIISTLSSSLYKGYEIVLKTAMLLKRERGLDFSWQVYGNINPHFVEHKLGFTHNEVNVSFMGVASAEELHKALLNASVYVHLSYIDNSPNSVCEAQITGLPVIATNVGGVPSLIKEGETGYLVPANDPYQTAFLINKLIDNKEENIRIGLNAKAVAEKRHDKTTIVNGLLDIYKEIISK